jgi:hypothetical protein
MILRRFDLTLAMRPEDVGMYTGATIHTRNGLYMTVKERVRETRPLAAAAAPMKEAAVESRV